MARLPLRLLALALVSGSVYAAAGDAGRVPLPVTTVAEGSGKCIAPPAEMRRTHMDLLKHQRDRTVRQGERGAQVSLNACIECHAGKESGSVNARPTDFCESCHAYAAVKLDCFECHQPRAAKAAGSRP